MSAFCDRRRTCEAKQFILKNCDFYFEKYDHRLKNGLFFVEIEEDDVEQAERCIENVAINAQWLTSSGWRMYREEELVRSRIIVSDSEIKNYDERRNFGKNRRNAKRDLEDAERDGKD